MSDEERKVLSSQEINDNIESVVDAIITDQRIVSSQSRASLIRQVFEKAGYIKPNTPFEDIVEARETLLNEKYIKPRAEFCIGMPASAWLTRFQTELDAEKQFIPEGMYKLILEIAERATK